MWIEVSDEGGQTNIDYLDFQGWARANVRLGSMWNIMPEIGGNALFGGDFPDGVSNTSFGGNLHLWGGDSFRYGAFGGATFGTATAYTFGQVGLETEADMSNATLGVQGFYSWYTGNCGGGCNPELYGANGWVDHHVTPNTKLTGQAEWVHVNDFTMPGQSTDLYGGGARITHRFAGSPLNVFAEANYWHAENGAKADYVYALGGITLALDGNGTQKDFDRGWAPFTFRNPLAKVSPVLP